MKTSVLIAFIVTVLVLGGVFAGLYFTGNLPSQSFIGECSGGWTTLGINDVTIVPSGDRIRVLGIAKGSECLRIQLSKNDINNEAEEYDLEVNEGVYATVKLKEYTKTFPISKTGNNFNTIDVIELGSTVSCSVPNCQKTKPTSFYAFRHGVLACDCYYTSPNGIEGEFSGTTYGNFKVEFQFGNDAPITVVGRDLKKDSDAIQQSVNFGNNRIEWVGSLSNLNSVSIPYQYDGRFIDSHWTLVNDGARGEVKDITDDFSACMNVRSDFEYCIEEYAYDYRNIIVNKLSEYKSQNSDVIYSAVLDDNSLNVNLKAHPFPAFNLDLEAEEVVIVYVEGKPKIPLGGCVSNQVLKSGTDKIVTFLIKNDANTNNVEFLGQITCDSGVTAVIPNFQIGAMETKEISTRLVPINLNPDKDLKGDCRITIKDQKSGDTDTCNFGFEVKYVSGITCTPDKLYCDESLQNIVKCNKDGNDRIFYKECEEGCKVTVEGAECKEGGGLNCNLIWEQEKTKINLLGREVTKCVLSSLAWLVILGSIIFFIVLIIILKIVLNRRRFE